MSSSDQLHPAAPLSNAKSDAAAPDVDATAPLLFQACLCQAAELARSGRYVEADSLLLELSRGRPAHAVLLDMRLRIWIQYGRLAQAEDFWNQALHLQPGNTAAKDGLHRIALLRQRIQGESPNHHYPLASFLAWLSQLAGILLLAFLFSSLLAEAIGGEEVKTPLLSGSGLSRIWASLLLVVAGFASLALSQLLRLLLGMEANSRLALPKRTGWESAGSQSGMGIKREFRDGF